MLVRGACWRCPWCGGWRAFFTGWFSKSAACRSCGLRWRRGDAGFELGAAAIAAIIVMGPLMIVMGIGVALTWPDIAVGPLLAVLVPAAVILPILLYPVSHTLWQALDLAMRPVSSGDFDVEVIASPDVRSEDA
jgi:uncharacterized protein (DUF983 family)